MRELLYRDMLKKNLQRPGWWILCLLMLVLTACEPEVEDVAWQDVSINYKSHRLDLDMYQAAKAFAEDSTLDGRQVYQEKFAEHRDFLVDWIFYGDDSIATDSVLSIFMADFLGDPNAFELFSDIQERFPEEGKDPLAPLEELLKRYKYHFPRNNVPVVVTFADGFPPSIQSGLEQLFLSPRYLGVGIHYLLGKSYRFYPPDLPQYLRRRCNPEHLPSAVAHKFAETFIPPPNIETNPVLIDHIIHRGLQMHLVDQLLGPHAADSLKLYYTTTQMDWATTFEARAYKEMVEHLYEVDATTIRRYVEDSPFTSQLNRESAPRLGWYIGWKIVQHYAQRFPEEKLETLIYRRDFQTIFKKSGYRPE